MRKYLILTAAAALLTACNDQQSGEADPQAAIAFDVAEDGGLTRAPGEITETTALLKDATKGGFGVFASYTGQLTYENTTVSPDYMYNQKVTWVGTSLAWTYNPVKYWPNTLVSGKANNEYVSFFAYAPYEATPTDDGRCIIDMSKATDLGNPWLNFRLPAKPWGDYNTTTKKYENPQQVDLLFGVHDNGSSVYTPWLDQTKPAIADKLRFTFRHALACIGDEIRIKLSNETGDDLYALVNGYAKIYIKKLTIDYKNLTTKARLDLLSSDGTPNWKEIVSGELTTTRTLVLNYDEEDPDATDFPSSTVLSDVPAVVPDYTSTDDAERKIYYSAHAGITNTAVTISTGKGLFYIPMQVAGTDAACADLTLEYQVINNIGKAYAGTATGSFPLNMNLDGKKQAIEITIKEGFKLGVLVYALADAASEPSYIRKR